MDWLTYNYNALLVVLGCAILGSMTGVIGKFIFLRKQALIGDVIAHSMLPGVVLAFWLAQVKSLWVLMLGAMISGGLALGVTLILGRNTKLKPDSVLSISLCSFFSLGMLLLSLLQNSGLAAQSGLNNFIFGQAASMNLLDVTIIAWICLVCSLICVFFFKAFRLVCFDRDFAKSCGIPVRNIDLMFYLATTTIIIAGIQVVGAILVSALLIFPASISSFFTYRLKLNLLLCVFFGATSCLIGASISYSFPAMPTGPWIVMSLGIFMLIAVFFAPYKGVWIHWRKMQTHRLRISQENVLKMMLKIHQKKAQDKYIRFDEMTHKSGLSSSKLYTRLRYLKRNDLVLCKSQGLWKLSAVGLTKAKSILRSHRLWEVYLTEKMRYKIDHVHPSAEVMEHLISPEIEKMLQKELGNPKKDPHQSEIDYSE